MSQETAPATTGTACRDALKSLESSKQGVVSQETAESRETKWERQEHRVGVVFGPLFGFPAT